MTAVDFGPMEGSQKKAPPRCNFFCENGQNRPWRLLGFLEASWVLPGASKTLRLSSVERLEAPKHYTCRAWSAWGLQNTTPVERGAPGGLQSIAPVERRAPGDSKTLRLSSEERLEPPNTTHVEVWRCTNFTGFPILA